MAHRTNHYDLALEDYLQFVRVPYVRVDEKRRAALREQSLKSFDYILTPVPREEPSGNPTNLLVDLKGRQVRVGHRSPSATGHWEAWVTRDDLRGLRQWEGMFGTDFRSGFLFAHHVALCDESGREGERHPQPKHSATPHRFADAIYYFSFLSLDDYESTMRSRSPSWGTVDLPTAEFRTRAVAVSDVLHLGTTPERSPAPHSATSSPTHRTEGLTG